MNNQGYSNTPLIQKLGITPSMKVLLMDAPAEYFSWLSKDITLQCCKKNDIPDLVHLFVKDKNAFESAMKKLKVICKKNTSIIIWVSWYKKSAKVTTDVTEDVIRDYALQNDLVDVKVCAVSDQWSGLKLVVPLAKR